VNLYIWEGAGISSAYHDDGTLVVLAESPEQAREIVRAGKFESYWDKDTDEFHSESEWWDGHDAALDREPDRVLDIDTPKWVAFNGGGYD
jgi:hypothetical protein